MQVTIYKSATSHMQSGTGRNIWLIKPAKKMEGRFIEPLMNRTSSNNMNNEIEIEFGTLEAAIIFAERNDYSYEIIADKPKKIIKQTYADNFK